jgi:aryl-phospho-beta-D-glucosidase BglC (GH1 family)
MHTTPGGQNPDWHSDNQTSYAAFWDFKDHQERTVWLWEQIAARYKDNEWVAGYNPLNEPCDPEHFRLPAFYDRIEQAIRKTDPNHILWLDGTRQPRQSAASILLLVKRSLRLPNLGLRQSFSLSRVCSPAECA